MCSVYGTRFATNYTFCVSVCSSHSVYFPFLASALYAVFDPLNAITKKLASSLSSYINRAACSRRSQMKWATYGKHLNKSNGTGEETMNIYIWLSYTYIDIFIRFFSLLSAVIVYIVRIWNMTQFNALLFCRSSRGIWFQWHFLNSVCLHHVGNLFIWNSMIAKNWRECKQILLFQIE